MSPKQREAAALSSDEADQDSKTLNPTEQRLRQQMEDARTARGLTHAAIAKELGIKPPSVTSVLTRKSGRIPQSLIDVLDVLGLEVAFVQKQEAPA